MLSFGSLGLILTSIVKKVCAKRRGATKGVMVLFIAKCARFVQNLTTLCVIIVIMTFIFIMCDHIEASGLQRIVIAVTSERVR